MPREIHPGVFLLVCYTDDLYFFVIFSNAGAFFIDISSHFYYNIIKEHHKRS